MRRMPVSYLCASLLLTTSCATVPRDAGNKLVEDSISSRIGERPEWNLNPSADDDSRVAAMLEGELTADRAVAVAMVNNPRLHVALAELGIARADLIQASTIANPLFEAEWRVPADPFHAYEFRLSQSLIELLQLPRRRALGQALFNAAQLQVTAEVLRFASETRVAYYQLLATSLELATSRTAMEGAKAAAEVAVKQHAAGTITDLDLEKEQAMYEQARLDLSRDELRLVRAREELVRAMGIRDQALSWSVPASFPALPDAELDQQQLEAQATTRRLDIAMARQEVEIAQRQVPLARLAALGDITGDAHYQRDANGARTVGPGIEFPIPIFNSGRAARTRAEAQWLRAGHTLNALLTESASNLRSSRAAVAEARARVEYYRDVVMPRRRRIVELTKLEHNGMLVGVFQLLQAARGEAEGQRDFIEAQREYWIEKGNLDRAINGIETETSSSATDPGQGKRMNMTRGGHSWQ